MKIAFCGIPIPHTGGLKTVYRLLREGMTEEGIDLRWVGLVPPGYQLGPPGYELSDEYKQQINFGEFVQSD
ncbi:MAG: hypothetical protein AAFW70_26980 [Cyanobacteria bacterium J06635_10]